MILRPGFDRLRIKYSKPQNRIYFKSRARFRIVPKGRRTGFTNSAANFASECCLDPSVLEYQFPGVTALKILWVDTIHTNIDRYVERYFYPVLKPLDSKFWSWKQQKKELSIGSSYIDFRSADRPENIEGFGYHLIILNEAGIILKGERGRYLWENALLPMLSDFGAIVIVGGTPKGKTDKKTGKETLYSKLAARGESNLEADKDFETIRLIPEENPFLSQDDVALLRQELTGAVAKQELDGLFVDIGSEEIFRREWFQEIDASETPERYQEIFASWDTAFGDGEENDFSAVTLWGVGEEFLDILYFWKGQVNFPDLLSKFGDVVAGDLVRPEWRPYLSLVEGKATGDPLLDSVKVSSFHPVERITPIGDKISRAHSVTPFFSKGKVRFVRGEWTPELKTDLANFPEGGRDATDTITQALNYIRTRQGKTTTAAEIISRSFSRGASSKASKY
jgi:phage terminase large subunit-like protein